MYQLTLLSIIVVSWKNSTFRLLKVLVIVCNSCSLFLFLVLKKNDTEPYCFYVHTVVPFIHFLLDNQGEYKFLKL